MRLSRVLGWVLGIAILVTSFFLPFWNLTTGPGAKMDTMYTAARFTIGQLSAISQWGLFQVTALAWVVLGAAGLVLVSGALGIFPRASGVLGVFGMLAFTLGPLLLFPSLSFDPANFGIGFWLIWGLSIATLVVGQFGGGGTRPEVTTVSPQIPTV